MEKASSRSGNTDEVKNHSATRQLAADGSQGQSSIGNDGP
jgi:hypothetical protein